MPQRPHGALKLSDFQRLNCVGCLFADEAKIGTGERACRYQGKLFVTPGGECLTRRANAPVAVSRREPQNSSERSLAAILEDMDRMITSVPIRKKLMSKQGLVLRYGSWYKPTPLPSKLKRGTAQMCFQNAFALMLMEDDYTYVEGFGCTKVMPGLPVEHAWCVNAKGEVIDPTWKEPGLAYIGIPFKHAFVTDFIRKYKVYGLMSALPHESYTYLLENIESAIAK